MNNKKQLPQMRSASLTYSGPIPPAEQMSQYSDIDPNFPQKIMDMAIREQEHRIQKEIAEQKRADKVVDSNSFLAKSGIFSAVGCVSIIMTASVLCAYFGQPWPSSLIGGGGLAIIVTVLVKGSRLNPNK